MARLGLGRALSICLMLAIVFCDSVSPVLIYVSRGMESPLFMGAFWQAGLAGSCFVCLAIRYSWLVLSPGLALRSLQTFFRWPMLFGLVSVMFYTWYAICVRFIDPGVTVILKSAAPLSFVAFMAVRFNGRDRYARNLPSVLFFGCVALGGLALTVASQGGGLVWGRHFGGGEVFAFGLALFAGVGGGLGLGYLFNWGCALVNGVDCRDRSRDELLLFGVVYGFGLTNVVGAGLTLCLAFSPVGSLLGLSFSATWALVGPVGMPAPVGWLLGGALVDCAGAILWRYCNLVTRDLAVNVLDYGRGPLLLLWMFLFFGIGVARTDYLILGVALIVVAGTLSFVSWRLPALGRRKRA